MTDRLKLAALLTVAILALGTLGLIVYNFVANDWRIVGNPLDVSAFFSDDELQPDLDERLSSLAMHFGDSVRSVRVESIGLHVNVHGASTHSIDLAASFSGDATDTSLFELTAVVQPAGVLHIVARPKRALGNVSGDIDLTIPESFDITIAASGGDVSVVNVNGRTEIETATGDIELTGLRGSLRCMSDTSSIILDACVLDSASISTGGTVTSMLTQGSLRVDAANVAITNHFGALSVTARNGISVRLLSTDAPVRLESDRADVRLRVLDGARFAYDVAAPEGKIIANVPFDSLTATNATEHLLQATTNGGGVPVVIRAAKGSVEILLFDSDQNDYRPPDGEAPAQDSKVD